MSDTPLDPLVAAVIHDAKNALMSLDTQLAGLGERRPGADIAAARDSTQRIAGQLTELLTLYRAQRGQLRLVIDDRDLHDFIDDLLAELGPLPAGKTLAVDRSAAGSLGAWAFDAHLVRLALLDALRNALRHAAGRVTLTLDRPEEGGLRLSVADDGPGYPDELLNGTEDIASSHGTGLGLAFARIIAARHTTPDGRQGRVELANRPGARFSLVLP